MFSNNIVTSAYVADLWMLVRRVFTCTSLGYWKFELENIPKSNYATRLRIFQPVVSIASRVDAGAGHMV